jgi:glucose/arabinose dehydrogenase
MSRLRTRGAIATCAALILAGCGGDDTASPSVTFSTEPPPTPTTIAPTTTALATSSTADATSSTAATTTTTIVLADPAVVLQQVSDITAVGLATRTGDPALYLVGQNGLIHQVDPVAGSDRVVLDVTDRTETNGEQGLLGLAFHPTEALAYINYTDNGGDTVIEEFAVADDGAFDVSTGRTVLRIEQPYGNHNGGGVEFGPDGLLYIGMGDGGSANDPERYSLNVTSLLGKMLRIDPLEGVDQPYTVPADNPYIGVDGARAEIWSVGVRNPWRFSFDSATGDIWIADVGQNELEEVSVGWADGTGMNAGRGLNFGWSAFEGTKRFNEDQPADGHTPPIHEYPHGDLGCSVSGGEMYRGSVMPELAGWYVYADFCSGQVRALQIVDRVAARELTLAQSSSVTAVAAGSDGELYVLSNDGRVERIVPAA